MYYYKYLLIIIRMMMEREVTKELEMQLMIWEKPRKMGEEM